MKKSFGSWHKAALACALVSVLLAARDASAQEGGFPQWGSLRPGPYAVGFKTTTEYDRTRTFGPARDAGGRPLSGGRARPIQLSVWYPAAKTERPSRMPYSEYVGLLGGEEASEIPAAEKLAGRRRFAATPLARSVPSRHLEELLRTRTAATRGAAPHSGTFPLVVFGQGLYFESPVAHSITCEYLASHGYVVAASPLLNPTAIKLDAKELEAQTRDTEFVVARVRESAFVDRERLGVVGFDMGGMTGLLLTMRNADVDAYASVDSGFGFAHNIAQLRQSPFFDPNRVRAAVLHMTSQSDFVDASLFRSLKYSDAYFLRFKGLAHFDFTSYGMIANSLAAASDARAAGAKRGYELACRYLLNFLDAHLKSDPRGLAFMRNAPEGNGVESGLLLSESKRGREKAPPTEEEFVGLIMSEGAGAGARVAAEVWRDEPGYVLFDERLMNALGYRLMGEGRVKDAVELFRLNVAAYPRSANAYDSLGEAYMESGERELAIRNYERSLELNPRNTNASERLKRLREK